MTAHFLNIVYLRPSRKINNIPSKSHFIMIIINIQGQIISRDQTSFKQFLISGSRFLSIFGLSFYVYTVAYRICLLSKSEF